MADQTGNPAKRIGLARFFSKGNPALLAAIGERIRREGKIPFADFMELALYHPEFGYYNSARERIGGHGDFVTSPETHPVFGALMARQIEQMWRSIGRPVTFHIVEMGAGPGSLCRDILSYARSTYPEFAGAIRYEIVESSADSISRQQALLRRSGIGLRRVSWHSSLSQLPAKGVIGCFLSNELVDAFPVHRVVNDGGEVKEIYVGLDGDELVEFVAEPSSPSVAGYFLWVGVEPPPGCQAEVNLQAIDWMKEVARHLRKGYAITVDYGHPARELYTAERPRGTLLCYYKQTYTEDPFVRVGQQDITAHVDFTALTRAGAEQGLTPLLFTTQRDFLLGLGLPAFLAALGQMGLSAAKFRANRLAMEELIKPDDLGRLRVLIQGKNIAASGQLSPPAADAAGLAVPLKTPEADRVTPGPFYT